MDESVIKMTPPQDLQAERCCIGAMIMDEEALRVCTELLDPGDFYDGRYKVIFQTLMEMSSKNIGVDMVTLEEQLKKKDIPPDIADRVFLGSIVADVPTYIHAKHYAATVKEKSTLRKFIEFSKDLSEKCYRGQAEADEIMDFAEKGVYNVVRQRGGNDFEEIYKVVLRTLATIEAAVKNRGGITGLETGFRELDYKTAGLQKSDLILIAARPAMGKTAFILNITEYAVLKNNMSVALFSLEMSKEQLMKRMFSMNSNVDSQKLRTGELDDEEMNRLGRTVRRFGSSNLYIDDTSGITASELRSKCRKLSMDKKIDLVIIDYLQLMSGSRGRKNDSRQNEIAEISRSLKVMARELNVPVIALSQLSRAVEGRPDKRPMLSDLRESGAIEQDADVVMFLYRDEYYHPEDTEEKGVAEVIIAKQRNGPTGTIKLAWIGEKTKFSNLEYEKSNNGKK